MVVKREQPEWWRDYVLFSTLFTVTSSLLKVHHIKILMTLFGGNGYTHLTVQGIFAATSQVQPYQRHAILGQHTLVKGYLRSIIATLNSPEL